MSHPDGGRRGSRRRWATALAAISLWLGLPAGAGAWGEEGHEVVALIAAQAMAPRTLAAVNALLATDASGLVAHRDIASEAVWADRYRTSHPETGDWHYIDNEIRGAPLASPGELLTKIDGFRAVLADRSAAAPARLQALQFLLHLIGDLHQPLHAADDHDRGGNDVVVVCDGFAPGSLHHYWDTVFVTRLGEDPRRIAARLLGGVDDAQRHAAAAGSPADWAQESLRIATTQVYGALPAAGIDGVHVLDGGYVQAATATAARRLTLAGLRLARVLDQALQ